jgi:hypothetical protein
MNTICPYCDSTNVEKVMVDEIVKVPFCDDIVISHPTFRCNTCEEDGDFDNSLDKELTKAIYKANSMSASKLMEELSQHGITMTYFEKALRLPFRTTARWKLGKISHSALALLRLIRSSPRLLEVADDNYSPESIAKYQISRTWDFFEKNTTAPTMSFSYEKDHLGINFAGRISSVPCSIVQDAKWEIER